MMIDTTMVFTNFNLNLCQDRGRWIAKLTHSSDIKTGDVLAELDAYQEHMFESLIKGCGNWNVVVLQFNAIEILLQKITGGAV